MERTGRGETKSSISKDVYNMRRFSKTAGYKINTLAKKSKNYKVQI